MKITRIVTEGEHAGYAAHKVKISPDSQYVAYALQSGVVVLLIRANGEFVKVDQFKTEWPCADLDFSYDVAGLKLVVITGHYFVWFYNIETKKIEKKISRESIHGRGGHDKPELHHVLALNSDPAILSISWEHGAALYDWRKEYLIAKSSSTVDEKQEKVYDSLSGPFSRVIVSSDKEVFAIQHCTEIFVYDTRDFFAPKTGNIPYKRIKDVHLFKHAPCFFLGTTKTLVVQESATGNALCYSRHGETGEYYKSMTLTSYSQYLRGGTWTKFAQSPDGEFVLFVLAIAKPLYEIVIIDRLNKIRKFPSIWCIWDVCFAPDSSYVVLSDHAADVHIINLVEHEMFIF